MSAFSILPESVLLESTTSTPLTAELNGFYVLGEVNDLLLYFHISQTLTSVEMPGKYAQFATNIYIIKIG